MNAAVIENKSAASTIDMLRIDGERLWKSLMELAKIGATEKGGVCRLTLTDLDKQGRDLVLSWAREAGMSVVIDKIGNGFMRRAGRNNSLPPIVTGSHIDTQPTGGKFDGNYGVLAGLEVVRTLNDHGIETEAPIEVAFWTNEEGSRFVPVMMGSGVFAKAFTLEHAYAARDTAGKSVKEELERIGYVGTQEPGDHPIGAYFETHIEQGPVLEDNDKTIGVVQGVLGIRWFDCTVTGMEAHAGPTPMALRKDALQVATHLMQEVVAAALRHKPHGRGTVGMVNVFPNSRNVIPGRVKFSIDLATRPTHWSTPWRPKSRPSPSGSARTAACRSTSNWCRVTRRRSSTKTAWTRWRVPPPSSATPTCRPSRAPGTTRSIWRSWRLPA